MTLNTIEITSLPAVNARTSMDQLVEQLNRTYLERWWNFEPSLPALGPVYTSRDKASRERQLSEFIHQTLRQLKDMPRTSSAQQATRERLTADFVRFATTTLDYEEQHMDIVLKYGFIDAGTAFAEQARKYDPAIRGEDIYQASRNVWTMNLLQFLLGLPVKLTPSIFAYSMLYPYTDNYLDDPSVSPHTKLAFSSRFRQRLLDEEVQPANEAEGRIFNLVGMIEAEFDRELYPQVYDSLLAIHTAQEKSLRLLRARHGDGPSAFEADVLGITFEKGGTSVLADGYLVAGDLTYNQAEVMYGYGVFTQLMDDQEDVEADAAIGQMTVFTGTTKGWTLDGVTTRMFRMGASVMDGMDQFDVPGLENVKEMFTRSINLLLIDAAGRLQKCYSREYLNEIEPHLPFRFSALARERRSLERRRLSLGSLVESLM